MEQILRSLFSITSYFKEQNAHIVILMIQHWTLSQLTREVDVKSEPLGVITRRPHTPKQAFPTATAVEFYSWARESEDIIQNSQFKQKC